MSLTDRQIRFVQEYCKDFNATQAYMRAGYSEEGAGQASHKLLKNTEIEQAIAERKQEIAIHAKIDASWVLKQWHDIATADANELMQLRRVCCRHCHGEDHMYQWTEAEFLAAVVANAVDDKNAPDTMGGLSFDATAEPHPECPTCHGEGHMDLHFHDTRKLTGAARRLYAGVQRTKEGIRILTRDQDAALANISRYLGMLVDKREISGPNGGPIPTAADMSAEDMSDDQLAAILAARQAKE